MEKRPDLDRRAGGGISIPFRELAAFYACCQSFHRSRFRISIPFRELAAFYGFLEMVFDIAYDYFNSLPGISCILCVLCGSLARVGLLFQFPSGN